MKKVLILLDNNTSFNVSLYGVKFAQDIEAEIGLVQITNYSVGNIDAGITPLDAERVNQEKAVHHIEKIKTEFPNINFIEFEPIGKPEKEIKRIIKQWSFDIVIVGHHTHSRLYEFFVKDTEEKLLHNLSIPILIIPNKK